MDILEPSETPGAAPAAKGAAPLPVAEIEALSGDPNFMTSLARGLAVIRAFSERRRQMTIAQISQRTGIPRAAVRRCLYTLAQLGYVGSDGRTFSLRPKTLLIGHAYLSSTPLTASAQPFLDRVSAALHEACSMAVLEGDDILYIARSATTTRIMSVDLHVGSHLPAYCTSMGRVLLAALPPHALEAYLARVELRPHTRHTLVAREGLRQTLEAVRRNGYAIVDQELEIGLRSIAVPVRDVTGRVVAAMNVGTQAARASVADLETQFLPPLRAASAELSMQLIP